MSGDTHAQFMALALAHSKRALPACLPNPPVGCVLVRQGELVASGYTQSPGADHAEAAALAACSGSVHSVTAYVTLEPCSFHGRTPACAKSLIARGIKKVVVAMQDPDPRNSGRGIAMLKAAGVEVIEGVMQGEVEEFIGQYLITAESR